MAELTTSAGGNDEIGPDLAGGNGRGPDLTSGDGPATNPTSGDLGPLWQTLKRYPLLDAAGERRLAERIARGSEAAHRLEQERDELTQAERDALVEQVDAGRLAKDVFVCSNLRLVASLVTKFSDQGVDRPDLFQAGTLGLIRAVEKFDHTMGCKLSTYASLWIRQAVARSLAEKARTIRVPVSIVDRLRRIKIAERQLTARLGRTPTLEEVAERLDTEVRKVAFVKCAAKPVRPLDGWEGHGEVVNAPPGLERAAPSAEDVALTHEDHEQLAAAIAELSPRDATIIVRRYGLCGHDPHTYAQLSEVCGLTREGIRQVELRVLTKLRTRLDPPPLWLECAQPQPQP